MPQPCLPGEGKTRSRDTARGLRRKPALYSPVAVKSVKGAVRMALTPMTGVKYGNAMNTLCLAAGDHREGVVAFREKRDAEFKP